VNAPTYLIVVASSCQLYSGTGTAIFDWIRFAKRNFHFSMLMDIENELNYRIACDFCREHGIRLYSSRGLRLAGCIDSGIREINNHLNINEYDFIECVSWANASTNLNVLASKGKKAKLVYTPHSQPLWTLPNHEQYFMTSIAFRETLNAADFVFVDSPTEAQFSEFDSVRQDKIHFVPLGVDTERYHLGTSPIHEYQILCVCDCREQRKRVDLLLAAFTQAYSLDNRLRLILGGKGSDAVEIPADISSVVTRLGYVEQNALIELYQTSALFLLLTDYEAFGLPIAEALCCGCPVLLNRLDVLEGLFSSLPGVTFTNNEDVKKTAGLICKVIATDLNRSDIAREAIKMFSFEKTYELKRSILLNH
jgi:glycosyltransferase involved in cell wall biosynthesis